MTPVVLVGKPPAWEFRATPPAGTAEQCDEMRNSVSDGTATWFDAEKGFGVIV